MWGLRDQMELTDGMLYRKWHVEGSNTTQKQLVVPQGFSETVLEQLQKSKLSGGHFAFQKTLDRARQRFWWPNMRRDIERKCENCTLCQARSTAGKKRIAPLQTIKVGIRYSKVVADILDLLPEQKQAVKKKYTRIDGLFHEIRGLCSLRKNYVRRCC